MSKTNELIHVADELKYLSDEYDASPLNGNRDGHVEFSCLFDYLSDEDNKYMIEHLIRVIKDFKAVTAK